MNRKGFMMAELVVVASVVIVTLVGLYSSYSNLYLEYIKRISYNDVTTLYKAGYYRKINKSNINSWIANDFKASGIYLKKITNGIESGETLILVNNRAGFLIKDKFTGVVNPTFLDYIDYFNDSVDYRKFNNVLLLERCASSNHKDDCSYAYVEVYENYNEYNTLK